MDPDAALRRDVRLLGDVLGSVLVEQEGHGLLDDEEEVRRLSRDARASGQAADREALAAAVRELDLDRQAQVLRAFGLYFQLANIAEQHHRLRRRRQYEREHRFGRESLAEAFARLEEAGVGAHELAAAAQRLSLELVLTAHPTEAARRTVLAAHLRLARLLKSLDDASLSPGEERAVRAAVSEEVTLLWQTDEVRSQRPRVVDEIRNGLWFFEQTLIGAATDLLGDLRAQIPGPTVPLRFGSWIGGDQDGNPAAGPATIGEALDRAPSSGTKRAAASFASGSRTSRSKRASSSVASTSSGPRASSFARASRWALTSTPLIFARATTRSSSRRARGCRVTCRCRGASSTGWSSP